MKDVRIATIVIRAPVGKIKANLDRTAYFVDQAKQKGASIVCFPEMNITGYSTRKKIVEFSQTIPGNISDKLIRIASESGLVILAGLAEKNSSGHIFASHLVAKPSGQISVYRKLYLAPPEQNIFTPADQIPMFEACGLKFGIQLCYDAHFPELSTYMAEAGADIIFFPHASPRGTCADKFDSWTRHLPARAFDNGLFILACNQTGDNNNGLEFPGIALAIKPSGEILNKKIKDGEGMLISDLKEKDLSHVRNHKMRYFLPNRRRSIFKIIESQ